MFILSLVGSGKSNGVDVKSGGFFKAARRSGLWPEADQVYGSSLTKARTKVCEPFTPATEAAVLVPDDPQRAVEIFEEILYTLSRVKYHGAKFARPSQPRINKRPPNKWCSGRRDKHKNS